MKKYTYIDVLIALFLVIIICITYWGLFQTFFQQDEWLTLGSVFGGGVFAELSHYSILQVFTGTGRPPGTIINYLLFQYFPFRIDILTGFALGVHALNSIVLYILVLLFTKKRTIAFITGVFFAINATASQSITWFASIFTTLPACTCIFISIILFCRYIRSEKLVFLMAAQFFTIIAYLFKESSIFLFFLFPIMNIVYKQREFAFIGFLKTYSLFIAYACVVIIARVNSILRLGVSAGAFVSGSSLVWQKMLMHVFLYPVLSLPQIFIPQQIMFTISGWFQKINYGGIQGFSSSQLGVETIVSDFVSFIMAVCILMVIYVMGKSNKRLSSYLLCAVLFTLASFFPYAILDKKSAYIDPRYFYIGSAGGGFILALVFSWVLFEFQRKKKIIYRLLTLSIFLLFSAYIFKNYQWITRDIRYMILTATERRNVLLQIRAFMPDDLKNPVFYVTGNHFGYYGIPEVKVPFQQGFGYTLMVWNYSSGTIPAQLLRETFLWRIREQGYKEVEKKGFGYFYDLNTLKRYVLDGIVVPSQVIGLYYDTDTKTLQDITSETRNILKQSL